MTNTLIWFRKGLRLHDNPALQSAAQGARRLWPVFILDPWFVAPERVGVSRMLFLLESLTDLDAQLQQLGTRLFVLRGQPELVLDRILGEWQIGRLCFERDTEPFALNRDGRVRALAERRGIEVITPTGHTLFDPDATIQANGGRAPKTYGAFCKLIEKLEVPQIIAPPQTLPPPGEVAAAHAIPTPAELGYPAGDERIQPIYEGGETVGRARFFDYSADINRVVTFAKPETDPTAFAPPSTTALGAHLKFGCLSARTFYHHIQQINQTVGEYTKPPVSLIGQIIWREFFYTLAYSTPNYDRMVGNPLCRQIPWDENPQFLSAWSEGQTGYPWIDAAMVQLAQEGWLHHLSRHAVPVSLPVATSG